MLHVGLPPAAPGPGMLLPGHWSPTQALGVSDPPVDPVDMATAPTYRTHTSSWVQVEKRRVQTVPFAKGSHLGTLACSPD